MEKNERKAVAAMSIFGVSVFLFLLFRFGLDILRQEIVPIDFAVYYQAWKAVLAGKNMYGFPTASGMSLRYAPFFGIIFSPLALLPFTLAAFAWSLINSAVFAAGISVFYFSKFRRITPAGYIIFCLLGIIFVFRSLQPEMKVGNTNLLALGLFFLFLFFYLRGKIPLSALFFTLMAFIKIGPLLILLYFIKKRQFKFILWFGIFTLLLVALPPLLLSFSFKGAYFTFQEWHKNALAAPPHALIHSQSLKVLLERYLTNSDIYKINFLSLSARAASAIFNILSGALVLGALFYKGWARRDGGDWQKETALIEISMLIILSVILSPASTYIYYLYLLAPLLALFLIGWGARGYYPKFLWFAIVLMAGLNIFTRNSTWRSMGLDNVMGGFPGLVFMVLPIAAIALYWLLYFLRGRLLALKKS